MTTDHRKTNTQMAQEVLLDDPGFSREIVERVVLLYSSTSTNRRAVLRPTRSH